MQKGSQCVVIVLRGGKDSIRHILVGKAKGSAEGVLNQVLREAAGKIILPGGDQITQFTKIGERRTLKQRVGGIDRPGLSTVPVGGSPFSGGVKVFEPKADGIDLPMTTRALRLFPMGREPLAGGQRLVGESRQLRHIRRGRGRRIVQQMSQDPGTPFDGATLDTIAPHRMDRGHPQEPPAG